MATHHLNRIIQSKRPFLITGHTGFKGTWLALLLREMGVRTVGISLPPEKNSLYQKIAGPVVDDEYFFDVREYQHLKDVMSDIQPQFVLHLAAQAIVSESYDSPLETFEVNVMGTANVLEAISQSVKSCTVGIVTTDKVYQNTNSGHSFIESDPLLGKDPYSASKVAAENVIEAWKTIISRQQDLKIATLRSGNVIGGGDYSDDRLFPDIIRAMEIGDTVKVRNPRSTRPWQHVLDPLIGYLTALEWTTTNAKNESFNFGPSESSLEVQTVLEIAKSEVKNYNFSYQFASSSMYEAERLDLNSAKSQELLGWTPLWSQEESVRKTIIWWESYFKENNAYENCLRDINEHIQSKR